MQSLQWKSSKLSGATKPGDSHLKMCVSVITYVFIWPSIAKLYNWRYGGLRDVPAVTQVRAGDEGRAGRSRSLVGSVGKCGIVELLCIRCLEEQQGSVRNSGGRSHPLLS
jgi:hypothetical protein